jgi:hypothetical protein
MTMTLLEQDDFEFFKKDIDENLKELRRYIQTVAAMCAKANPNVDYVKILDEISNRAEDSCNGFTWEGQQYTRDINNQTAELKEIVSFTLRK